MRLISLVAVCNNEQEIDLHYHGRKYRRIDEHLHAKDLPLALAFKRIYRVDTFYKDDLEPDGSLHVWLK